MKLLRMITMIFLTMLLVSDTTMMNAQIRTGTYKLVFSDEFNQKNGSQPDTTKWSRCPRTQAIGARWISDVKETVFIRNGKLICRAIPNTVAPEDTAAMLTGAVYSKNKFAFQYGKVMVRLRTNLLPGNFPAAWMGGITLPQNRPNWYGEIDIFESFGTKKESNHNIHSELTIKNRHHQQKNNFRKAVNVHRWHIYGIEWDREKVIWYVDGVKVGEYAKSEDPQLLSKGQWTFDRPFYLLLNQSVGDGSHGLVPDVTKTYETQFDWIRVYQNTHTNE